MEDLTVNRNVNVQSKNNRLTHNETMEVIHPMPAEWRDGDCVTVVFPNNDRIHLFHEAEDGSDAFSYTRTPRENWTINIEKLPASPGNYGTLKIVFSEDLLDIQKRDDDEGR